MRRLMTGLIAAALLLQSCVANTMNVGGGLAGRGPVVGTITVPGSILPDGKWHFSVSFSSGQAPYTISWNFGGGAFPNTILSVATSPDEQAVDYTGTEGTYIVTVTVTDSLGQSGSASSVYDQQPGGTVHPLPPPPPPRNLYRPTLEILSGEWTDTITVKVDDEDNGRVVVTALPPTGLVCIPESETLNSGSGKVILVFSSNDLLAHRDGLATFLATDGIASHDTSIEAEVFLKTQLGTDAITAVPQQETAVEGETVTIVVASTQMDNPFQYMNGCRVFSNTGFEYVDGTFNVGSIGGAQGDTDGIWSSMNPEYFLLAPDNFIVETDLGNGRTGIDFNVTPIGGHDITEASGDLFNFGARFSPGLNIIRFQDVYGVSRTYYTDSNAAPDRFWADSSNYHDGIPNSVEVN